MEIDQPGSAILLDANLLVWAHHRRFLQHGPALQWVASALSSTPAVGIPWPSVLAFMRLSTHPRALEKPLDVPAALGVVNGWLKRPNVLTPVPTDRHLDLFGAMVTKGRATGNHSSDAHLAALAVEWGLTLVSADRDFARYPDVRWHDPTQTWD